MPADSARGNAEASLASNLKDAELYSALPSGRGFKLASLNIFKLTTHIDELRIFLANNDIDIISINETKLDEVISDNEVSIPGYDIIRRDRLSNGGGGICFYVRSSIEYSLRNDLSEETLENLCLEIRKPKSKPFVVVTWYRPPDSHIGIFSHFENLVGKLDSENIEYYLMGDINCDMIATRYDNNTQKLKSIADVYGLQQLITEPTRIPQTSATCIDLIYTNCADKIVCSGVRHISISDHSMVFAYRKLSINGTSRGHNVISYKNFRKFNKENFRNDIASQNWDQIYNSTDPNEMWSQWKCLFLPIANKHAPLRTMRVRARSSPWITSTLKRRMHDRDILKIKASKSKNPSDWVQFKKQRNIVNKEIRLAKQAYYQNTFNENKGDSKRTWQTINEPTSRKSGKTTVTSLKLNGLSVTNPSELSDKFNNHFATIGSKLASEIDSSDTDSHLRYLTGTDKRFELRPTSTTKVFSLLNKLNKSEATGLDKISGRLLRECVDLISSHLHYFQSIN